MADFDQLVSAFLELCHAEEHLQGQHDQQDHAGRRGGGSDEGGSEKRNNKTKSIDNPKIVYHGTTVSNIDKMMAGSSERPLGMSVTDTEDKALQYANAQATGIVTGREVNLVPHAAVVEMELDEAPEWIRRPKSHNSLDKAEAIVKQWKVKKIKVVPDSYWRGNETLLKLKKKYGDKIQIEGEIPNPPSVSDNDPSWLRQIVDEYNQLMKYAT